MGIFLVLVDRDYQGPNSDVLQTAANNIPKQTQWDLHRAWGKVFDQLPPWMQPTSNTWGNLLKNVTNPPVRKPRFITDYYEIGVHAPQRLKRINHWTPGWIKI